MRPERKEEAQRIGQLILTHRIELGLSQRELGDLCGVSKATISYFEMGKMLPAQDTLSRLLPILHIEHEELMLDVTILTTGRRRKVAKETPLAIKLRELRQERGLTQHEVCKRHTNLSDYENGKVLPTRKILQELAGIYGVPEDELLLLRAVEILEGRGSHSFEKDTPLLPEETRSLQWPYVADGVLQVKRLCMIPPRQKNLQWPYVADGVLQGERARIIAPPAHAYKPLAYDYPRPVWTEFEHLPAQWFPQDRLHKREE